ncbi:hypothetical protein GCM10009430_38330 [Aquimarina litoralis]|uniref:Uncharacterized protein n=1 Tax=Aquimarina litoralis TaxID=584605 RepID=A0ABP3UAS9_9FLAO
MYLSTELLNAYIELYPNILYIDQNDVKRKILLHLMNYSKTEVVSNVRRENFLYPNLLTSINYNSFIKERKVYLKRIKN